MKDKLDDHENYGNDPACKEYSELTFRDECNVTYNDANQASKNCNTDDSTSWKWSHNLCFYNSSDTVLPTANWNIEKMIANNERTSIYADSDSHMTNANFKNKVLTNELACGEGWLVVPGTTELVRGATKNGSWVNDDIKRCVGPNTAWQVPYTWDKLHRAKCVKVDAVYSEEGLLNCCFGDNGVQYNNCPPYHCKGTEQGQLTTDNCGAKIKDFCTKEDNLQTETTRCKGTSSIFNQLLPEEWENSMDVYCDGDNLKKDVCISWCDADISKCKVKLDNYCSDKMGSEEDVNICACFYPPEVYENYKNVIREKVELDTGSVTAGVTIDSLFRGGPYCFYDKCGTADLRDIRETCPDIILSQCIQNVKIGAGGNVTGTDIEVNNQQDCDINIKNDTTCNTDQECADKNNGDINYTCVNSECKFTGNSCSVSSDCTNDNEECQNGICVTVECTNNNDCYNRDGIFNECNNIGKCVTTSCDNDEECITKFNDDWAYCKNNVCRKRECFIDENCTGNGVCLQGKCIPVIEEDKYYGLGETNFYILVAFFSAISGLFISLLAVTRPLTKIYKKTKKTGKTGKLSPIIIFGLTALIFLILSVGFIFTVFFIVEFL